MIGVSLILIGYVIRVMCVLQMKKFDLTIRPQDEICDSGIYRYVRHPSYIGSVIMFIGMTLLSEKLALLALVFAFFLSRALQEENLLRNNPKYLDYMAKTGMFFPKLRKG
jgi:protein-S-isoprenylcysteine O-methyltransferase Ste14